MVTMNEGHELKTWHEDWEGVVTKNLYLHYRRNRDCLQLCQIEGYFEKMVLV